MTLKQALKRLIVGALYWSGALRLYARLALRRRAFVLMYHRVLPQDAFERTFSNEAIIVTPETFERHMQLLKRWFAPVPADEFLEMVAGRVPLRPGSCLVTFDDGWWDNYHHAAPILTRHGVPAVVFIATDFIGSDECFWQEKLSRLLFLAWRAGTRGQEFLRSLGCKADDGLTATQARARCREFVNALKARDSATIEDVVQRATTFVRSIGASNEDAAVDRFMTWNEIEAMSANDLVTIGSHAQSHVPLTRLDPASAQRELLESKAIIETRLRRSVTMLAYPNGDHDSTTTAQAQAAGYELAFTTVSGHVSAGDSPQRIKRINIAEAGTRSDAGFLARVLRLA